MRSKKRVLLVGAFLLANSIAVVMYIYLRHNAGNRPGARGPFVDSVDQRIQTHVDVLRNGTVEDSIRKLSDVEMFYWPGSGDAGFRRSGFPLDKRNDADAVKKILSNRRFLKVVHEARGLPKGVAGRTVGRQIRLSLEEFRPMYENYISRSSIYARPARVRAEPPRAISNSSDGSPTLLGLRYQLLALVLVAGSCELEGARPAVREVVQTAIAQFEKLSAKDVLDKPMASGILMSTSLYNRQVLGTALVGVGLARLPKHIAWEEERTTAYDARATRYDLHAMRGAVPVDYGDEAFTVRFLGSIGDNDFRKLVEDALSKP